MRPIPGGRVCIEAAAFTYTKAPLGRVISQRDSELEEVMGAVETHAAAVP